MKVIKLSVFALSISLFAISCGGAKTEEGHTDSSAMATTETPTGAMTPPADTNHVDTQTAKPAKPAAEVNAAEAAKK